jgi:deazaflavin-dependent oxidoreductase (nitroreductase family)
MTKTSQVPRFVLWGNKVTTALLRSGVNLNGPGKAPMYLLTVRGRKSGLPRTTPIAVLKQDGNNYVLTPYGVVDWVRNLRAAGEAVLTRGRREEKIRAVELTNEEASQVLRKFMQSDKSKNPIGNMFNIKPDASSEEFEQAALEHPVFQFQTASTTAETRG